MVALSMMPNIQMVSLQQSTSLSRVARSGAGDLPRFAEGFDISRFCEPPELESNFEANLLILYIYIPTRNLHDSNLGDFRYYPIRSNFIYFFYIILSSPSLAPKVINSGMASLMQLGLSAGNDDLKGILMKVIIPRDEGSW